MKHSWNNPQVSITLSLRFLFIIVNVLAHHTLEQWIRF